MVVYSSVCDTDPAAYREYLRVLVCERLYNGSDSVDVRSAGGVFDLRLDQEQRSAVGWVFGGIRSDAGEAVGTGSGSRGESSGVAADFGADGDRRGDARGSGGDGCTCGGVVGASGADDSRSEFVAGSKDDVGGAVPVRGGTDPLEESVEREAQQDVGGVSLKTLANRAKREKKKLAKERKRSSSVPEWRRKDGGVGFHKGVFSECSQEKQLALRESRASMLIAKNRAAEVKAEECARRTAAMLKSRVIEEQVERERLELEKKMKGLRDTAAPPQGYCETVLSALATPSLSDGTVSPDSSISMAEVHKKDEAIKMLVNRSEEQRKKTEKAELAVQELAAKFEKFRQTTRESTLERARRDREREEEQRCQRESKWGGLRAAYDSGAREYSGDGTTKVTWVTDAEV